MWTRAKGKWTVTIVSNVPQLIEYTFYWSLVKVLLYIEHFIACIPN